jgi:hypothetical protein
VLCLLNSAFAAYQVSLLTLQDKTASVDASFQPVLRLYRAAVVGLSLKKLHGEQGGVTIREHGHLLYKHTLGYMAYWLNTRAQVALENKPWLSTFQHRLLIFFAVLSAEAKVAMASDPYLSWPQDSHVLHAVSAVVNFPFGRGNEAEEIRKMLKTSLGQLISVFSGGAKDFK